MRKRFILGIALIVLVILSIVQITIDYLEEKALDEKTAQVAQKANYSIFIEVEDKKLYLLQDGKCIRKYPVATGASGMPSPLGCWKIVSKGDWGEGFGGRWMGLNVPCPTFQFGIR